MGIAINVTDKEIGLREDLADILTNITPTDTPFISSIGRTKASNVKTEWLTDTLDAAASAGANAYDEGFSATNASAGVPTRLANYTQIFSKFVMVSESDIACNPAGRSDVYQYTLQKKTKELARDIESACIVQSAGSSGEASAGTARLLEGLGLGGFADATSATASNAGWISANYYIGTALGGSKVMPSINWTKSVEAETANTEVTNVIYISTVTRSDRNNIAKSARLAA